MALKCRGPNSPLNFAQEEYDELLPMLPSLTKVGSLDRAHIICCSAFLYASACAGQAQPSFRGMQSVMIRCSVSGSACLSSTCGMKPLRLL